MNRMLLTAAVFAVLPAPVLAQEAPKQTVEGAHRFLRTVAEQHGMEFELFFPEHAAYANRARYVRKSFLNDATDAGYVDFPPIKMKEMSGAKCDSTLQGKDLPVSSRESELQGAVLRLRDYPTAKQFYNVKLDTPPTTLTVNWSRVPGIERNDKASTQITLVKVGRVTVPTVELAARVQYAMEFLRNACDPTAATGF